MKRLGCLFLFVFLTMKIFAVDTLYLSLDQVIERSKEFSLDALVAQNSYLASYWQFRSYKAGMLPQIGISATLPYYSKSYNQFQDSEGNYSYISNYYSSIATELFISQHIPFTGGRISLETSFQQLRQFGSNGYRSFVVVPAAIRIEQPLFAYNPFKWSRKVEPLKYQEAQRQLTANMEQVSLQAIQHYFDLLLCEINADIARQNLLNTEKIYTVATAKHAIGQFPENDLMGLKVSLLNAEIALANTESSVKAKMMQLCSFLGYGDDVYIKVEIPNHFPYDNDPLDYKVVLQKALENSAFTLQIQREMIESEALVRQAKTSRWSANLFVSLGFSGVDEQLATALNHEHWRDNQIVNLGLSIPILDWGKGKGKVKMAEANREIVEASLTKEQQEFDQNVYMIVQLFNDQFKQLELAKMTDEIARKRYAINVETYLLGKTDMLNLNDAQLSKDEARRNYVEHVYRLWSYYYRIRALTLCEI
ncbi:TolC family protein [Bacteroidales bacterium OttesenSCG-928-B11]|nr:TolC family protein [Bacteroidales bacterium OttesenSCG-928-B11]